MWHLRSKSSKPAQHTKRSLVGLFHLVVDHWHWSARTSRATRSLRIERICGALHMMLQRRFSTPAGMSRLAHSLRTLAMNRIVLLPTDTIMASRPCRPGIPITCKLLRTAAGGPCGPGGPRRARGQEPHGGAANTKAILRARIHPKIIFWTRTSERFRSGC